LGWRSFSIGASLVQPKVFLSSRRPWGQRANFTGLVAPLRLLFRARAPRRPLVLWDEMVWYFSMNRPPSILKLSEDNESQELEFELEDLRSLSFEERSTMMRKKFKEMLKQLVELGYRRPFYLTDSIRSLSFVTQAVVVFSAVISGISLERQRLM
jgi:hypothetical protein